MARESVRGVAAADLVALLAEQPSDTLKDLVPSSATQAVRWANRCEAV